jgi:hypothetical protein
MISRVPQKVFDRLFDPSLVTIMGLPPKDPNNDEEDEEDDEDESEEKRAVVGQPDEWPSKVKVAILLVTVTVASAVVADTGWKRIEINISPAHGRGGISLIGPVSDIALPLSLDLVLKIYSHPWPRAVMAVTHRQLAEHRHPMWSMFRCLLAPFSLLALTCSK